MTTVRMNVGATVWATETSMYTASLLLQVRLYEDFAKSRAKQTVQDSIAESDKPQTTQHTHVFEVMLVRIRRETTRARTRGTVFVRTNNILILKDLLLFCQALQYLRKLSNHPSLVLTPKHPQFEAVTAELRAQNSSVRSVEHAPKLAALK